MEPAAAEVLESLRRAPRVGGHSSRGSEDSGVGGSAGAAHAGHCPPLLHADAVLRCLDKSHDSEACTLCTAAPGAGETNDYKLIAHGALKHGERTLRSQVVFSREWGSSDDRIRLAEQLARTPGCERLAALLRRKDCAALRKADLITLARAWGYKSCIWVRKRRADSGAGGGGGAGAAASARAPRTHADAARAAPALLLTSAPHAGALALASAALRERTGTRHDALAAYLAANLVPMCAVARTAFQGRAVRAPLLAAAASGRLQLPALAGHTARVQAWHPVAVSFGALVRAQHAAVAARLTALDMAAASGADDEADVPAWRALAATAAPGEEEFRTLYTMHSLGDAAIDEIVRSSNLGDEVESVWAHEAHSGHVSSLELASAAGALLAHAKMGPLREYVRTAAALLELLTCYLNDCLEALGVRAALLDDVARAALAAAAPPTPPFSEDGGPKTAMAPGVAAALALAAMPPRPCTVGLPPPGQAAAGSHFLRIWQSLMFHGVRPGLTA